MTVSFDQKKRINLYLSCSTERSLCIFKIPIFFISTEGSAPAEETHPESSFSMSDFLIIHSPKASSSSLSPSDICQSNSSSSRPNFDNFSSQRDSRNGVSPQDPAMVVNIQEPGLSVSNQQPSVDINPVVDSAIRCQQGGKII